MNLPAVKDAVDVLTAGLAPDHLPPVVVGGRVAVEHSEAIRALGAIPVIEEHPAAALTVVASLLQPSSAAITSAGQPTSESPRVRGPQGQTHWPYCTAMATGSTSYHLLKLVIAPVGVIVLRVESTAI